MLQIKNTLGGGKPEGLYAWQKSTKVLKTVGNDDSYTVTLGTSNVYVGDGYSVDYSTGIITLTNPVLTNLTDNYLKVNGYIVLDSLVNFSSEFEAWGGREIRRDGTRGYYVLKNPYLQKGSKSINSITNYYVYAGYAENNDTYQCSVSYVSNDVNGYVVSDKKTAFPYHDFASDSYYYDYPGIPIAPEIKLVKYDKTGLNVGNNVKNTCLTQSVNSEPTLHDGQYGTICRLDDNRFLSVTAEDTSYHYPYARVVRIGVDDKPVLGTGVRLVSASYVYDSYTCCSVERLSSNRAIVFYRNVSNNYRIYGAILSISDDDIITMNKTVEICSTNYSAYDFSTSTLSNGRILIAYRAGDSMKSSPMGLELIEISDDGTVTVLFNNSSFISGGSSSYSAAGLHLKALDNNTCILVRAGSRSYATNISLLTVSETNATKSTELSCGYLSDPCTKIIKNDDGTFLFFFRNTKTSYIYTLSLSDGVFTIIASQGFSLNYDDSKIALERLDDSRYWLIIPSEPGTSYYREMYLLKRSVNYWFTKDTKFTFGSHWSGFCHASAYYKENKILLLTQDGQGSYNNYSILSLNISKQIDGKGYVLESDESGTIVAEK